MDDLYVRWQFRPRISVDLAINGFFCWRHLDGFSLRIDGVFRFCMPFKDHSDRVGDQPRLLVAAEDADIQQTIAIVCIFADV